MAGFPILGTGAIAQYPLGCTQQFATDVVQFVDGTEQRYRRFAAPLRQWSVQLSLLTETELAALTEFFEAQQGALGTFSFADPNDGTVYDNCYFAADTVGVALDGQGRGAVALVVQQGRD
jgi:uncharacterized protein (TIGR02217 family)